MNIFDSREQSRIHSSHRLHSSYSDTWKRVASQYPTCRIAIGIRGKSFTLVLICTLHLRHSNAAKRGASKLTFRRTPFLFQSILLRTIIQDRHPTVVLPNGGSCCNARERSPVQPGTIRRLLPDIVSLRKRNELHLSGSLGIYPTEVLCYRA